MKKSKIKKIVCGSLAAFNLMLLLPQSAMAEWRKNNVGWWFTEGSSWATGWRQINGAWYYFNSDGYMATGWKKINGDWYYLNPDGDMATGWKEINGVWYYLNPNGDMATGWKEVNGKWYFLSDTGSMLRSCKVDGYQLGADGAWIEDPSDTSTVAGWKHDNIGWWYLEENGDYAKYWKSIDEGKYEIDSQGIQVPCKTTYYFGSDGYMKTGWQYIDGKWYYFYSSGEMASDAKIDGGYIVGKDGAMIDSLFVQKEEGDIVLKPLKNVNPIGTEVFEFYVINNKEDDFTSYWGVDKPGPYTLEKYEDGQWNKLKYKSGYDDFDHITQEVMTLVTKTINLETVKLSEFEGFDKSKAGKYRITFYGMHEGDESRTTANIEFEIK